MDHEARRWVRGVQNEPAGAHGEVGEANADAVEGRVEDGGNGHAYTILSSHEPGQAITWWEARAKAEYAGGHLATLATEAEANWVFAHVVSQPWIWPSAAGPWIGALRCEFLDARGRVLHAWRWIDGTPWSWDPWSSFVCAPPVDDCPKGPETALCLANPSGLAAPSPAWTCAEPYGGCPPAGEGSAIVYALVEFDHRFRHRLAEADPHRGGCFGFRLRREELEHTLNFHPEVEEHTRSGFQHQRGLGFDQYRLPGLRLEQVFGVRNVLAGGPDHSLEGHHEGGNRALLRALGDLSETRAHRNNGDERDQAEKCIHGMERNEWPGFRGWGLEENDE
jgi:hypothetical protein